VTEDSASSVAGHLSSSPSPYHLARQFAQRYGDASSDSQSSASLNRTLTSNSLNQLVAWVREVDGLCRALAV